MRIVHYCQHVLGMGHFFRSLEIDKALEGHDVTLITGGAPLTIAYPDHVNVVELPPLSMDENFGTFVHTTESGTKRALTDDEISTIQQKRTQILCDTLKEVQPDVFLVELFPFGRKRFSFELMPALELARQGEFGNMRTVCSVRDILVEKNSPQKFETRVVSTLNSYFDCVLVHTDPNVITLDATFEKLDELTIPVHNTGYITPLPCTAAKETSRKEIVPDSPFILGSIGSGSVYPELMENLVRASTLLVHDTEHTLLVSTGPFMNAENKKRVKMLSEKQQHITVTEFIPDFVDHLCTADLSVSMAGYNTTMNLLAVNTFGLVFPFDQNREQRLRSTNLERLGVMKVLEQKDISPQALCILLRTYLQDKPPQFSPHNIDLHGAQKSAVLLEEIVNNTL